MSHLIEGSLFNAEIPQAKVPKSNHPKLLNKGEAITEKCQSTPQSNKDTLLNFQIQPYVFADKNCYVHKIQNCMLVLARRKLQSRNYRFQGFILFADRKLCIQYKQKRILFGKQWMKLKHQSSIKVSINFSTGQLQILWPQIFCQSVDSILNPTKNIQKTLNYVFKEFVQVFQNDLIQIFHKIGLFQSDKFDERPLDDDNTLQNYVETDQSQKNTVKMLKYLYMSTIIDSFDRDKQTFRQNQDKESKEKQTIIKIQNNIDKSFANISNELKIFTNNSVKKTLKHFNNFGVIQTEEKIVLQNCLGSYESKGKFNNKNCFILNCIDILKIENKKKFLGSGGSSNVFLTKIKFQYMFSDDPQFWINQNKKITNNIIENAFVIKQAKKGFEQKIKHENQIIKQMKGGFSIFLPKYYKIQNSFSEVEMARNQSLVIMDYLRGDSLDIYSENLSEVLSFWSKVYLIRNIVSGLRLLVDYKIVHLDLKPSNVIVLSDLLTKIIDFSESYHSKICKSSIFSLSIDYVPGITMPYACPELFSKQPINYDQKFDIFSLGVIMYQLFMRRPLFQIKREKICQIYEKQQYMKRIYVCPEQFDSEEMGPIFQIIYEMIMRCLDPRPEMRPTINWISIIITHVLMYYRGK